MLPELTTTNREMIHIDLQYRLFVLDVYAGIFTREASYLGVQNSTGFDH
jgi:hypothetical protein